MPMNKRRAMRDDRAAGMWCWMTMRPRLNDLRQVSTLCTEAASDLQSRPLGKPSMDGEDDVEVHVQAQARLRLKRSSVVATFAYAWLSARQIPSKCCVRSCAFLSIEYWRRIDSMPPLFISKSLRGVLVSFGFPEFFIVERQAVNY